MVGFDDVPAVAWMDPPLTTVHQPLAEMVTAATEPALALGRGEEVPQAGREIATTLTVRESTSSPEGGVREPADTRALVAGRRQPGRGAGRSVRRRV